MQLHATDSPVGTAIAASLGGALASCGSGKWANAGAPEAATAAAARTTTTKPYRNGPFGVGRRTEMFVDASRPTSQNGAIPWKPTRTLETIIEYPARGTPDP